MDYVQVLEAKTAGIAAVEVLTATEIPYKPPQPDERLKITVPRYDTYTKEPIAPEVITYRKADLLREIESIKTQRAALDAREAAINGLLAEFPVA